MFQQLLEDIFSHDAPECGVGNFLDELPNLLSVVSKFVDKLVGVDGAVVDHCFDLHGDVVLGDHLLRSHSEHRSLHVHLNHVLADRVDQVESWLQDLHISTEGLVHAQSGSGDLVDGALETAADAGAPDVKAAGEGPAALEAGFVAGAFEFFCLEVLEVIAVALLNDLVLLLHQIINNPVIH